MVRQWGEVVNFGRDPLTLSRQTFDDGLGDTLQGPLRVVWMDEGVSQMCTYDATSSVDKGFTSPEFGRLFSSTQRANQMSRALHQRALLEKGFSSGSPRGWAKLVPWYANDSRSGPLNRNA